MCKRQKANAIRNSTDVKNSFTEEKKKKMRKESMPPAVYEVNKNQQ